MAYKHDRNAPGVQEMAYLAAGAEQAFPSRRLPGPRSPGRPGQLPVSLVGMWFWSFSSGDVQSHHKAQRAGPGSSSLESTSKFWHQTAA